MRALVTRQKGQPAPAHVVWEALTDPRRAAGREWLRLERGEVDPEVVEAQEPTTVVWSSLWPDRPADRSASTSSRRVATDALSGGLFCPKTTRTKRRFDAFGVESTS